jgi:hypothetical protein
MVRLAACARAAARSGRGGAAWAAVRLPARVSCPAAFWGLGWIVFLNCRIADGTGGAGIMPLFGRRSGSSPAQVTGVPPRVTVDDLMGDQVAHRFATELAAGRWQELHDFLAATHDAEERFFYVNQLSRAIGERPEWVDEWCAARRGSALPVLFSGALYVRSAWEARGARLGKYVTQDAFQLFHDRLVRADRDLAAAAELDPRDPTPHAESIWVALGLSLGQPELHRRFTEVNRRHPWHSGAYRAMSQGSAPKWGGSLGSLFGLARQVMDEAPEGHSVHSFVPTVHFERWLNFSREQGATAADRQGYFRTAQVRDQIGRAAQKSVNSPAYQPGHRLIGDRTMFSMAFWLLGDYRAQLEQMELTGPVISSVPWNYRSDPVGSYQKAWQEAAAAVTAGRMSR